MSSAKLSELPASREILWNVSSIADQIALYSFLAVALAIFTLGIFRRYQLWRRGAPASERLKNWGQRFKLLWHGVLMQEGVNRAVDVRGFHSLIFLGFLILLFTTTMVFIDHDLGIKIYRGDFYLIVTLLSDIFGILFLLGIAQATYRRYVTKPDHLHNVKADAFMLGLLAALIAQGFVLEGLRIHVTKDPWAWYSPIGLLTAQAFWPLSVSAARTLHYATWWIHSLTVFAFIAFIPYSKFFHLLVSSANIFFGELRKPKGAMRYPGDIEKLMEAAIESGAENVKIGVRTLEDLSWKQRLDLDSCTSCGRCQEVCPAYLSEKPLSPKWLILDNRNHMLKLFVEEKAESITAKLDQSLLNGLLVENYFDTHSILHRARNPRVQAAAKNIGISVEHKLAGDVVEADVFWSCTTCRACMEVCPVGIEHVDLILDVRRAEALIEGNIPKEALNSLRAIETRGNPLGPPDQRADWTSGLDVKILSPGDKVEVLYWVGCVSAYDKRKQKIARSLASILNCAGLSWGILGNRECCTGDPARRLGEENIFQNMAKKNIATLQSIQFEKVVANCPHCFNSLKNEYGEIGEIAKQRKVEIIHHSQLIRSLLAEKKIHLKDSELADVTFHDPCYLGRYNDEYSAPREILVNIGKKPVQEMEMSKQTGLCCGAGGGHFWMDMKIGKRINSIRTDQAAATGASLVATACPFCMQMMEDGVKLTEREDAMSVRDIAEIVAERL